MNPIRTLLCSNPATTSAQSEHSVASIWGSMTIFTYMSSYFWKTQPTPVVWMEFALLRREQCCSNQLFETCSYLPQRQRCCLHLWCLRRILALAWLVVRLWYPAHVKRCRCFKQSDCRCWVSPQRLPQMLKSLLIQPLPRIPMSTNFFGRKFSSAGPLPSCQHQDKNSTFLWIKIQQQPTLFFWRSIKQSSFWIWLWV